MTRYLKALGLAAFAALAASAMLALAASAEEGQPKGFYTAGKVATSTPETSTLVGKQYDEPGKPWNFFETTEGEVKCDNATFTSTIEGGTQSELTVTPHYEECVANGQPATVNMNGCTYVFKQPTTAADAGEGNYTAKVGLTCPQEKTIQIGVYLFGNSTSGNHSFKVCSIEVYPSGGVTGEGEEAHRFQEFGGESHVILDTTEETVGEQTVHDVTIAATVEGIVYNDKCNSDEGTEGIYKNTVTATAWDDGEEPHEEVRSAWIEEEK